jgi:hypothetical protein
VWGALNKAPKHMARNPHHTLIFADGNPELDRLAVGIPASVLGKSEEHAAPRAARQRTRVRVMFSTRMPEQAQDVELSELEYD